MSSSENTPPASSGDSVLSESTVGFRPNVIMPDDTNARMDPLRPRTVCNFCGRFNRFKDHNYPDAHMMIYDLQRTVGDVLDCVGELREEMSKLRAEVATEITAGYGECNYEMKEIKLEVGTVSTKIDHLCSFLSGAGMERRIQSVLTSTFACNNFFRDGFFDELPLKSMGEVTAFFSNYTKVMDLTRYLITQTPWWNEEAVQRIHKLLLSDDMIKNVQWLSDLEGTSTLRQLPSVYKRYVVNLLREIQTSDHTDPIDLNVHEVSTKFFPHREVDLIRIPPPPPPRKKPTAFALENHIGWTTHALAREEKPPAEKPAKMDSTNSSDTEAPIHPDPAVGENPMWDGGDPTPGTSGNSETGGTGTPNPTAVHGSCLSRRDEIRRLIQTLHGEYGHEILSRHFKMLCAHFPRNESVNTARILIQSGMPIKACEAMILAIDCSVQSYSIY